MSENSTSSSTSENTEKVTTPKITEPAFGWNTYAEQINGRFAMLGFVILLLLELFTHQDLFSWLGWR
ncbi:chlorophyll a/b-binding protein [Okeania sp.]|uniref:chlorophyll a/b-binding protein n=1 Tax=Okeania sp. TaxID=3100323 RepID=UPI002B4B3D32|nr:chlorophyll a/b-binding protein [Okeania sp.]MEB3340600.1 chlorophyll a/b-binding protein [Okeania sp.]